MGHLHGVDGGPDVGLIPMRPPALWKPGLLSLMLLGPFFFLSYGFANRWAAAQADVPSIVFGWERHIPFVPWTILPYWSIDPFYGLSLLICGTRQELARHLRRLLTAQVLCIAGFLLYPLRFSLPRPHVAGWEGQLFEALARFDLPYNQAPSLHIALALILWDFYRRRVHGAAKTVVHVWSALIAVSVLTTYQHHFIDIPTGLLAGALCLWLWPLEGETPKWQWTDTPARRRLALIYGCGAIALAMLAGLGRPAWWLYWPAFSLALVGLCYAGFGPGGFQKRIDGRHQVASRLLFAPYQLAAWLNARHWTRGMPSSVAITERVWLGRLPLPWEADHARFGQIIDLTAELSLRHRGSHVHPWLDLVDPTPADLLVAAQSVQRAAAVAPALVCCALGFSRSPAVVATWLCLYAGEPTVDHAVRLLRRANPRIVLSASMLLTIEQAVTLGRAETIAAAPRDGTR